MRIDVVSKENEMGKQRSGSGDARYRVNPRSQRKILDVYVRSNIELLLASLLEEA